MKTRIGIVLNPHGFKVKETVTQNRNWFRTKMRGRNDELLLNFAQKQIYVET
jgi:hypothetical protein